MNVNQPNMNSWHAMYSVNDRQKVVQILTATLKEIQNTNYDGQKAALMAQEFEKHTFMKSQSRDEYLRIIKQRITQLRSGIRNVNGMSNVASGMGVNSNVSMGGNVNMNQMNNMNTMNTNNMSSMNGSSGANSGSNFNMNPNYNISNMNGMGNQNFNMNMNMNSSNMNMNMNNVGMNSGMNNAKMNTASSTANNTAMNNMNMNNMNMNNTTFLQQQAQAREQSAAQIQANQMRNMNQNPAPAPASAQQQLANAAVPSGAAPQTLNQQQISQITNMLRSIPIPQALLAKIPNLPPNVNTWTQIFDCFQKKMIPPSAMPIIKEIHNTHLQLAIRQHQQRKMSQLPQAMNNAGQQAPQQNLINNQNFNINQQKPPAAQARQSPQQNQQFMQRQQLPVANTQAQSAMSQQIQNVPNNAQSPAPNNQRLPGAQNAKPPSFNITPQDVLKYSSDAMLLLRRLQSNGSIQGNLDHNQRENFVKKYIIHQKTLQWRQQNGQTTNNNAPGASTTGNPNTNVPNSSNNSQMRMQPNMNLPNQPPQSNQAPMMNNKPQPMVSPVMNQRVAQVPAGAQVNNNLPPQQPGPQPAAVANQQMNQKPGAMNPSSLASILPPLTDEMKVKLRQLIEEVSRNNVALKDVSNLLSQSDKTVVRDIMSKISQHYANVDSIVSYFFILTRNVEGTKRLIQMKYMTKSIMENLQRGSFLASPDLAEKLRAQYTKYFDYVREQFSIRRQQMQQAGQGQQQPAQQQQAASVQQNQQMRPMQAQQNPLTFQKQQVPPSQSPQIANQQFGSQGVMMQKWNQQQQQQQPVQQRSSPALNNQSSPIISQGQPQRQTGKAANSKKAAGANGRRKSTKNASVGSIPTPSAIATTPASLANNIKTPNSIPTPQVPQTQSNKNTPTGQSPSFHNQGGFKLSESTLGEIFSVDKASPGDAELSKRRELSGQDPEKFFLASLANLLEIDGNTSESKSLPTPSPSLNGHKINGSSSSVLKSPLSPSSWTATIKPEAITTSFRQVDVIRELTALDILQICDEMGQKAATPSVKRERDFDDMDLLFLEDKKPKINDQFAFMYNENIGFDEWKSMITTSMD